MYVYIYDILYIYDVVLYCTLHIYIYMESANRGKTG